MRTNSNLSMVQSVVEGLGNLVNEVVFVGGAVLELYIEDPAIQKIRPTQDVDFVVELDTRTNYYKFEEKLRQKGFKNDIRKDAPICRWIFKDITVDAMPTDEKIIGFSNIWYSEGIRNPIWVTLPHTKDCSIALFSHPYFLASKLEAFKARGNKDYIGSPDLEDILTVLDGTIDFEKLRSGSQNVKTYLRNNFKKFLADPYFLEIISIHIEQGPGNAIRRERIINMMQGVVNQKVPNDKFRR